MNECSEVGSAQFTTLSTNLLDYREKITGFKPFDSSLSLQQKKKQITITVIKQQ